MFTIFGSKNSLDLDVLVFQDSLGTQQEGKDLCLKLEEELKSTYSFDKKVNVNIGVVKDGIMIQLLKGTIDEVNNSLLDTYDLHDQLFPKVITKRMKRDVDLKILRTLRVLLSLVSRTGYRDLVKAALKGDAQEKYDLLMQIDLGVILEVGKNMTFKDYLKTMAFQMGQTLALIEGVELYTKDSVGDRYPILNQYLSRQGFFDLKDLDKFKMDFLGAIKIENLSKTRE